MSIIDETIAAGPFRADWNSLTAYQVPTWYQDGKFGIFIHWGVYSVPAWGNEWYPRNMYQPQSPEFAHHVATYGPQAQWGYKDFIPQFTGAQFDADRWATLFREAGARFVVPVAEHHDGFAMYDCSFSNWTATKMGPQRDIIGELAAAVRAQNMVFGVSSHRAEHWWFFDGGRTFPSDVQDEQGTGLYAPAQPGPKDLHDPHDPHGPDQAFLDDWLARTTELVDKYQPQLIWFDWWIEHAAFTPYLPRFAAYYYNRAAQWQQGVAINYKWASFAEGSAVFDIERGQVAGIHPRFWQNDTSVSKNSWGYVQQQDYKTATTLIGDLVDVVSKNGALLLNIGPRPDGTIPPEEERILREIGAWLRVNGEAIYNTRPWNVFGEGPTEVREGSFTDTQRHLFTDQDFRFTVGVNALYAVCLGWPEHEVCIRTLNNASSVSAAQIAGVTMLGADSGLHWWQDWEGLHVQPPPTRPCEHAYTFKIMLHAA